MKGRKCTSKKREHHQRDAMHCPIAHMDYDGDSEMTRNEIIDNSETSRVDEHESEWEVSDFSFSGDSMDEWLP